MTVLLDRYELGALLGTGGMGRVLAAYDRRLERPVAVKLLREELFASATASQRLIREARAAARLDHPNTVSVFDVGEHEGRPFIVMELVTGESLADRIRTTGALPPTEAVAVIGPVLDALAAAHELGLVHRDVKPSNVLLPRPTGVKLADFGIATDLAAGAEHLTGTGELLGSPSYLAPERVSGEPATPATDLYAVGVTLYEALSGRVPFAGASPVATAIAHQQQPVPPLTEVAPNVPPALAAVAEQALAKQPDRRFDSARSMHAALTAAGAELPPATEDTVPQHDRSTAVMGAAPPLGMVGDTVHDSTVGSTADTAADSAADTAASTAGDTRRSAAAADTGPRRPGWLAPTALAAALIAGIAGFALGGTGGSAEEDTGPDQAQPADESADTDAESGQVTEGDDDRAVASASDQDGPLGLAPLDQETLDRETALVALDDLIRGLRDVDTDDVATGDHGGGNGPPEAIDRLRDDLRDVRDEDDWADQREDARELIGEVGAWHLDGELDSTLAAHTVQLLEALQRPERGTLQAASRLFAEVAGTAPSWGPHAEDLLAGLESLLDEEDDPGDLRDQADELRDQVAGWAEDGQLDPDHARRIDDAVSELAV